MTVKSIINKTKQYHPCHTNDDILDVAVFMVTQSVNGVAIVNEEEKLVGILTDSDIIRLLVDRNGSLKGADVKSAMSRDVITCKKETKLAKCLEIMGRHKIRHLVVVEEDHPVGVVSIKNVLEKIHADEELEIRVLKDMAVAGLVSSSAR